VKPPVTRELNEDESEVRELLMKLKFEVGYSNIELGKILQVDRNTISKWFNLVNMPRIDHIENMRRLAGSKKPVAKTDLDNESIKDLIKQVGGVTKASKLVGKSAQLVYMWKWGKCVPSSFDRKTMINHLKGSGLGNELC
jgi:hypothetical protein